MLNFKERGVIKINIILRTEKPEDYNQIANLNYDAFNEWHPNSYKAEPLLVSILRHSQYFDKELSIVAKLDGKIVGHALFSIFPFVIMKEKRMGAILAPICVDTKLQKEGIGRMLIEEGHKRLHDKGVSMALLCGHENYYPKFGYLHKMFALAGAKASIDAEKINTEGITERSIKSSDLDFITRHWHNIHKDDRLALYPGDTISQWFNHSLIYRSSMIYKDNTLLGYIRYRNTYPLEIKELLATEDNAEKIIAYIMKENLKSLKGDVILSLSLENTLKILKNNENIKIEEKITASNAFMMKVIDKNDKVLERYTKEAKSDNNSLGIISFPPMLEIDD